MGYIPVNINGLDITPKLDQREALFMASDSLARVFNALNAEATGRALWCRDGTVHEGQGYAELHLVAFEKDLNNLGSIEVLEVGICLVPCRCYLRLKISAHDGKFLRPFA